MHNIKSYIQYQLTSSNICINRIQTMFRKVLILMIILVYCVHTILACIYISSVENFQSYRYFLTPTKIPENLFNRNFIDIKNTLFLAFVYQFTNMICKVIHLNFAIWMLNMVGWMVTILVDFLQNDVQFSLSKYYFFHIFNH